jgi:hypothetical protein
MFAGEGDPVKDTDVPDEETHYSDYDDYSDSVADTRVQFRNDIKYPLSPFESPQVDVVTACPRNNRLFSQVG